MNVVTGKICQFLDKLYCNYSRAFVYLKQGITYKFWKKKMKAKVIHACIVFLEKEIVNTLNLT